MVIVISITDIGLGLISTSPDHSLYNPESSHNAVAYLHWYAQVFSFSKCTKFK